MVFGGIPFYRSFLKKGFSIAQNIDNALFVEDAPLKKEFECLYASIFKSPEVYLRIISTLETKKIGMTHDEIIKSTDIPNSGDLTAKLEELESYGFIRKYPAFGRKPICRAWEDVLAYLVVEIITLIVRIFLVNPINLFILSFTPIKKDPPCAFENPAIVLSQPSGSSRFKRDLNLTFIFQMQCLLQFHRAAYTHPPPQETRSHRRFQTRRDPNYFKALQCHFKVNSKSSGIRQQVFRSPHNRLPVSYDDKHLNN